MGKQLRSQISMHAYMLECLLLISSLIALGGFLSYEVIADMQTIFSVPSQGSIRYWMPPSRLHVEGRYIKNEQGQIVNLTGVNFDDLGNPITAYGDDWDGTIYWRYGDPSVSRYEQTKEVITPYLVSKWSEYGINSVRLLLNWYVWKGIYVNRTTHDWPEYIPQVDLLIEECSKKGIYVALTFFLYSSGEFDGTYNTPETFKQEWINFLVELVTRYEDDPTVAGIDIINEPKPEHWAGSWEERGSGHEVYYSAALEAAQAIYNANPNILIIIETGLQRHPRWTKFDPYLIDNPIHTQVPNVVYEFHRYYFQTYLYRSRESPDYPDNGPLLPDGLDYPASYENGEYELARQQMEQVWYNELFHVLDEGYSLWYGEFGFKEGYDRSNPTELIEPAWDVVLNDTLQLCNKYGVGWSYLGWGSGIADRYGMLLRDEDGVFYTVFEEPKASIIQQNFLSLPPPD